MGQKLIMINALFGFFWSAGSVAGPVVSGMLIRHHWLHHGLIVTTVASGVLFLLIQCLQNEENPALVSREDDMD